jgi:hypothetical protein
MKLIELMFCHPQSELAETLNDVTCILSDLQSWDELTETQKADLFGKMLGAKQAIEHCCRTNFRTDPNRLPSRLEDVSGVHGVKPWNLPPAFVPEVSGSFVASIPAMLGGEPC